MNTIRLSARNLLLLLLGCCFALLASAAENLAPVPALTAPVMDTANMLQPDTREDLNGQLQAFSRERGSQIVVLTVPTIAPETPFDYATRVMNSWKPGRKGIDDGVLLLLVRDEHKTFLAPGRGLEGAIPDVYAKRILDDVLRPQLRANNADGGVRQAVDLLEKLIKGEKLPAVQQPELQQTNSFTAMLIEAMFLVFIAGAFLKNIFGNTLGSAIVAFLVLTLGWYIGWNLFITIIIAIVSFVVTFIFAGNVFIGGYNNNGNDDFWGRGGGSGGGFGGGGGGYGGGGASGNW
ncbi:YgcG family protein [Snodgrassella sp. ESL0253]|uniref:TPM domain-containing protein n=1 Tax=Snodgrassella sp. ESL0253 TaxID=2705031 RepID=UPI001581A8EE|nr:TPM domain-containing protein [Snodgrassella sp. ESL0253]NUE67400.1 TPM domain-containing protein [Snodgrassella sp. ESL0253]